MDPMEEGKLAAANDLDVTENPYAEGTDHHARWEEGYWYVKNSDEEGEPLDD